MRESVQGVRPLTRKLAGVTAGYIWVPMHAVGSTAAKTRAVFSGVDTEADLVGTNTTAFSANPGWLTGTGDLLVRLGQTAALAAFMDLQTLGAAGSLLLCCDLRAAGNPASNATIFGRNTSSGVTNGAFHMRASTAGVMDFRLTPIGGADGSLTSAAGALLTTGARQSLAVWIDAASGTVQMYSQGIAMGAVGALPVLAERPKAAADPALDFGVTFGGRLNAVTTVGSAIEAGTPAMRVSNGLVARFTENQSANIGAIVRDIARFPWEPRRVLAGLV